MQNRPQGYAATLKDSLLRPLPPPPHPTHETPPTLEFLSLQIMKIKGAMLRKMM